MVVNIQPAGIIRNYFPYAELELTLEDQATIADLYNKIGESPSDKLPEATWNGKKAVSGAALSDHFKKSNWSTRTSAAPLARFSKYQL